MGYSPCSHKELDRSEQLTLSIFSLIYKKSWILGLDKQIVLITSMKIC